MPGRPPKRKRNTTGLRNQGEHTVPTPEPQEDTEDDSNEILDQRVRKVTAGAAKWYGYLEDSETEDFEGWEDSGGDVLFVDDWKEKEFEDEELQERMFHYCSVMDNDAKDEDWVPELLREEAVRRKKQRRQEREQKERPQQYYTGPVFALKSVRSQFRHKSSMKGQGVLTLFGFDEANTNVKGFRQKPSPMSHTEFPRVVEDAEESSVQEKFAPGREEMVRVQEKSVESVLTLEEEIVRVREESIEPVLTLEEEVAVRVREESVEPVLTLQEETVRAQEESAEPVSILETGSAAPASQDPVGEAWEEELDEYILPKAKAEIRGWEELRDQIKEDLSQAKKKHVPLSQINQLLIIRNFATLRLKGFPRIEASQEIAKQWHEGEGVHFTRRVRELARHYQVFEQLPRERRGGMRTSMSLLSDEGTRKAALMWLSAQKVGTVTPRTFREALNSSILPSLGIQRSQPLSTRTARRWLVKLGWRLTRLRKGVYMDGHERPDVVKYRNESFLPAMEKYERQMTHYDENLKRIPPVLCPGEKEIIPQFHDESCFHMNDIHSQAWLGQGQSILQKKGKGRFSHVSDFINQVDGRLVLRDADGNIIRDARQVIYPGANGDDWWDTAQLLEQVKDAISIFEAAHPNCVALFIFDQSSAHASLGPDALRAFDMNKSDGGKQRRQKDTIIPQTNPDVTKRGKPQKMTTSDGKPKGLEAVLTERGFNTRGMKAKCQPICPFENDDCCMARLLSKQDDFLNQPSMLEQLIRDLGHECIFLPKFHCELNPIEMYWGWCKYRYRDEQKNTFAAAKGAALKWLDACPTDVIRRFINRAWRFMSAYRRGLTGRAAEWAVKKQRGHRAVSERAMTSIEAVLN